MDREQFILALDAGTSSNRAILYDRSGKPRAVAQKVLKSTYPKAAWVEQDAAEIWDGMRAVIEEVLRESGIDTTQVAAIGISNQRETTILWDRRTGKAVAPAVVWQCRRTAEHCEQLKKEGLEPWIRERSGLPLDAYFSAGKLRWLLQDPALRQRAEAGELCFGTVDTWLLWNLSGGKIHATDVSNASRTQLMNLKSCDWDAELLKIFQIPATVLPEIKATSGVFGYTDKALFGVEIMLGAVAGDQQAALFGQRCFNKAEAKNTYGTGCFLLQNIGSEAVLSRNGLITTVAWKIDGVVEYALEGSVFVAGAAVQWLRDELGLLDSAAESETLALSAAPDSDLVLVPAFTGLGAPYWEAEARGAIFGLTRDSGRAELVRAGLESLAQQTEDLLSAMASDCGYRLQKLAVDGGAASNQFLMQYQANLSDLTLKRPVSVESSALGAAFLAGLAAGFWADRQALIDLPLESEIFESTEEILWRLKQRRKWQRAIAAVLSWSKAEGTKS